MEQDLEKITKTIQKKLGKDTSAKIADDIASILSIENSYREQDKAYKEEIKTLKDDKEMLIQANGNLLQQVPMGKEEDINPSKKEEKKESAKNFDFSKMFDEKGNFIK